MTILIAMDRATVRRRDANGFLHVELSNISKANVCPYYGREIPDWQQLGLDADEIYYLYRDPAELERGAETFNNVPLLSQHVPVIPDELPDDLIIGSTGTDAEFSSPYLRNSLVIWCADAQEGVEQDKKRELSCGYRYRPDMTPGVTPDGLRFDGVMRDIIGNHVALVIEGRAGPDVLVGDEVMKLKSRTALMISGALQALIRPILAADAKVDLAPALGDVDAKSMAADGAPKKLAAKVGKLVKPHLAADAQFDADAVAGAIAAIQPLALDEDKIDEKTAEDEADEDDDDKTAQDAEPDPKEDGDDDDMGNDEDEDGKGKGAMDKATVRRMISDAEKRGAQRVAAIEIAKKDVFPHIGEVTGLDSAEAIYKLALDAKGIDVTGVHKSAYKAMVAMIAQPAEFASDAAPTGPGKLDSIIPGLPPVIRS